MKAKWLVLSTGFALFSMFFGSGNLVFPLTVGRESGGHFIMASLGIFLTGVIVPFLGVFALWFFKGDHKAFFGTMGRHATFWFPLIALGLMGPFGVLARCITVAHGSFKLLFPSVSLIPFSLAMLTVIYAATMNKSKIVSLLGSWLTPFLLLSLAAIAFFGFAYGDFPAISHTGGMNVLSNGILQGYQTMDLLGAFFFSSFVITHLQSHQETSPKNLFKLFMQSIAVGGGLLALVYFVLVYLGAKFAVQLQGVPPEEMLGVVTAQAMGNFSAPIVCIAAVLACFTTAVVLAQLFADFLKTEVTDNKISSHLAMLATLVVAFGLSTLEFSGIAKFLGPILETLYPALIVLTVMNILSNLWELPTTRWPVAMALVAKLCFF